MLYCLLRRWFQVVSFFAIITAIAAVPAAETDKNMSNWTWDANAMKPFWLSATMFGESVMPLDERGSGTAVAPLMFVPDKIISVTNSAGSVTFQEGRDYQIKSGSAQLLIPKGTTIPLINPDRLRAKAGTQQFALTHRDGKDEILYGGKLEWQNMQIIVNYSHRDHWKGHVSSFSGGLMPHTLGKLRARKPVTIVQLGDSISAGCNASKYINESPFQPAYGDLFVEALKHSFDAEVNLKNLSVGGKDANWGTTMIDQVVSLKPDLVIIAFGMNDAAGGVDAATYAERIKAQVMGIRKALPQSEFILVASMLGNADWTLMKVELFPPYRDALAKLCAPGIVLADMTAMWTEMSKVKRCIDITGNGVNHPNDFGHRLYAQMLSAFFIEHF